MLEPGIDQGEGLRRSMPPQPSLRVMAMVSRGESKTEQPLLWQVCTALQNLGHTVAVLDGTSIESEDNPGLQNLLDNAHWLDKSGDDFAWQTVPARRGLAQLASRSRETNVPLQALSPLFKNYSVVLVYARAELLISLFPGTEVRPLLAVAPFKNSIVNGYQILKQLLQQARLVPTLVSLVTTPLKAAEMRATTTGRSLQSCARTYLGCHTEVMNIRSFAQQDKPSEDTPRLVLRLLESALSIGSDLSAGISAAALPPAHFARSQ